MALAEVTKDSMQAAFAVCAQVHEAASIRRCSSTWNVLCTFLYSGDRLAANPLQLAGRPKPSPRPALHHGEELLETVEQDGDSKRQTYLGRARSRTSR